MNQFYNRRNIIIGLFILTAFLAVFVGESYRNLKKAVKETRTVNATLQSLRALEDVMDDMQDIETGQRGYIISGNQQFLAPYYTAIKKLAHDTIELKALYSLYPDREATYNQLLKLIYQKTEIAQSSVKMMESSGNDAAYQKVQSGMGRLYMDSIRNIVTLFEKEDRFVLQQSNANRGVAAKATAKLFITLAAIFITGLIIVFWRIGRWLKQRERYEQKISYLAGLTEKTSDAFFSIDLEGVIVSWNKGAEDIYGYSKAEAIGKFAPDITRSSNTKEKISAIGARVPLKGSLDIEAINYNKNGEEIHCLASVTSLKSETGKVTGYVVVLRDITQRKKNEELLKKFNEELTGQVQAKTAEISHSNERFEMIGRTTNDAIWEWNLETGAMWGNETHQYLYGLTMADPVPHEIVWAERIHPDEREAMIKKQNDALASGANVFIIEYRFRTEKEGYRNIYDRCYIVRNEEGKAIRMLGNMMDITERKSVVSALQESEEKYRTMIEQASDGILILTDDGRYVDVNPAGCLMVGYTLNEMLTLFVTDMLPDGELPMTLLRREELKSGQTVVTERKLKKKNGELIDVEASYKMLSNGYTLTIARDITEKKKVEKAIRVSEETRKLIMNSALDAIVCIDISGAITVWTPQAERIFGWKESEAIGKKLTETIIPVKYRESHSKGIKNYVETGNGPILNRLTELTAINRDGKEFPIELSIIPIKQDESEFFCAFIRNITERKEAAEKIIKEKELADSAIDSLPGVFYIFDKDRKLLKWNKNFETVSGYSAKEITQVKPLDFFAEEDRELAQRTVEDIFTKGSAELEAHFLTKKGEKILYYFTGRGINYEGKPCMLGTGIDIAELRKSQQNYAILVNTIDGIVWEADAQTFQFSFVSQQAERLLGYPREQWINNASFWADHIHPEDKNWVVEYCVSCTLMKKAHEFEYRMIAADGQIVWLRDIVTVIVENEQPVQLRGLMVDITHQKIADEEIVKSNARFQMVSKATSDIVWDWDIVNDSLWRNDNYYANFGYKKYKEIVHIDEWFNCIHPNDIKQVKSKVYKTFEGKNTTWRDAYHYRKADGTYLNILDRGFILRDKDGKATRMIGSMVDMTPVYESQKKIAESENRLQTIINSNPQCIKLLDKYGLLLDMNPAGLALIEADSLEQVKGHQIAEIIDEEYRNGFRQLIKNVFKGEQGIMLFSITGLKGGKRWLETHSVPMKDADGKITALLGVTLDVTDKKKTEQELIKNEEKYRTLVEQAVDAIALYDATGKILDVNTGSVNLLGYSKEELMEMSLQDVLTKEEIRIKPVQYDVLQQGKSTVKQRKMRRKDNSIVETEVRSQQLPDGRFLSVIRDLTEREKAQRQIEQEKELSDKLIDSLPGVFYWFDESGKFLRWNLQFEIVTGYSAEEIAAMHPTDFFEGAGRKQIKEAIKKVFSEGTSDAEADFISKDGTKIPYCFKAIRIYIENKPCLLGTGIDISDRKKAERELNESYKAIRKLTGYLQNVREQERTHIAREIHDELGQQLTVLKMDVSWLNKKITTTDDAIKQKMKSLLAMLDGTVKTVRRISSELRPSILDDLGLTSAIEWHLSEFEKRSGIKTRFVNSGIELDPGDAVKTALFRIFQESLTNVARHSNAKNVMVSLTQAENSYILSIADDGKGFDKQKNLDKRTLGILGMRERTAMVDGTYEITGTPGKGTVVTVKIPFTLQLN